MVVFKAGFLSKCCIIKEWFENLRSGSSLKSGEMGFYNHF
jgi:hypothetical protein